MFPLFFNYLGLNIKYINRNFKYFFFRCKVLAYCMVKIFTFKAYYFTKLHISYIKVNTFSSNNYFFYINTFTYICEVLNRYMGSEVIIHQLLIFGVLMVVGALGSYFGIIKDEAKDFLSRFIIDITLPCLIFSTFAKIDSNPTLLINGLLVFGFTFVNLAIALFAGTVSARLQGLNPADTTVHSLHTMFGNIVFLGYPLFDALFPGGIGIFYAAAYQLASNSVTFTYGIYRLSAGQAKSGLKSLLNINTFALLIGFTITAFGIKIPAFLIDALSGLGKATSPLSMVYIGALLMGLGIRKSVSHKSIYLLSLNKLILLPVFLGFIYLWIFRFFNLQISSEAFIVLVMQMAMPCQTIIVVMSRRYGGNYQLAAGNLFVSTILSIATLPAIYIYLNFLLK